MDGELVPWAQATVHASTLGWSTMGAVFEGIKAYWNEAEGELYGWQFAEHYQRFAMSMRLQRMRPQFTPEQLVAHRASCCGRTNTGEIRTSGRLAWHADATWFGHLEESRTGIVITTAPFTSISGKAVRACVSQMCGWATTSCRRASSASRTTKTAGWRSWRQRWTGTTSRSTEQPGQSHRRARLVHLQWCATAWRSRPA